MADSSVVQIVAAVLDVPEGGVDDYTGPATEGRWTSLSHLKIMNVVQRSFALKLTPREIRSVRTVGELRRLLGERGVKA